MNCFRKLFLTVNFLFSLHSTQAQLSADFSATPTQGCAPLDQVQFTDLSTGNPTSWLWNFGNGNTSSFQNPSASYPNPGTYSVTLTVYSGSQQNSITKTNYITVFARPQAHFVYSPSSPCIGSNVQFTDNSILGSAPIISWNWDFGDGNTLITPVGSASHAYSTANFNPLSLIVTDANNCTGTFDTFLVVSPKPQASFTYTPQHGCNTPFPVYFSNTSLVTGSATYLWNFGDGGTSTTASPQHSYMANGIYPVSLVVNQNNSCSDSILISPAVIIQPAAFDFYANDSIICIYDSAQFFFAPGTSPAAWIWNFGDGTTSTTASPWHHFNAPGIYSITLSGVDAFGCTDTVIKTAFIKVNPQPVAHFGPLALSFCMAPQTVQFTDSSTGAVATWNWSFGDGTNSSLQNPVHTFNSSGFFVVGLLITDSSGCSKFTSGFVQIVPPEARFKIEPKQGCAPLDVTFTSTSVSQVEPIVNHTWNFGAGQGSPVTTSLPSIQHTYNSPGVYTVSLIIETQNGCRDTLVKTDSVKVGYHVTPSFTISDDTVCYKDAISFFMNSPGANSWTWIFGDGTMDSLNQDPVHIYNLPGSYQVSLVACNNGCCDTLHDAFTIVILEPRAQMLVNAAPCNNPFTITVSNSSTGADSSVWNFGDGTIITSTAASLSHTYPARGTYTITLKVFNFTTGCVDSISSTYRVTVPIAQFGASPLSGCYPLQVSFADTAQDAYSRLWYWGDGTTATTLSPIYGHTYLSPGYFTVKLIVSDIHGCLDTLQKVNYIHAFGPESGFNSSATTGCRPFSTQFTDTSQSEYPVIQHIWNYGDGSPIDTAITVSTTHTYTQNGNFTVTLMSIDSQGCRDTSIKPLYIEVTFPTPVLTVDTFACRNQIINFNASATTVATPAAFIWNFGDGTLDTTLSGSATHAYSTNGIYTFHMTVTDRNGCDSTISGSIHIESPVASFTTTQNPQCGNNQVVFNNTSTGTAVTGAVWMFGDGGLSTLYGPVQHNYVYPGVFPVTLIAINAAGCSDTLTLDSVVVVPGPYGSFTFNPKSGCTPLMVTFTASSPNSINYTWDFGDGTVITTNDTFIVHTYTTDVYALPILTLSALLPNGQLCQVNAPNTDSIYTYTNVGAFIAVNGDTSVTQITLSDGGQVNLSVIASVSGNAVYHWTPEAGLSAANIANPVLTATGTTQWYYLEVTDDGGCKGYDSVLVKFVSCEENAQAVNVFTPNQDGLNDYFFIDHACPDQFKLLIYNRWGQLIFETSDPVEKWDGRTLDGHHVPSGTYYWIATAKGMTLKGFVQLILDPAFR